VVVSMYIMNDIRPNIWSKHKSVQISVPHYICSITYYKYVEFSSVKLLQVQKYNVYFTMQL